MLGAKRFFKSTAAGWLVLATSAALTWVIYRAVLSFPFLFDDIIHLRWLGLDPSSPQGRGICSVWVDIVGMQHYRPLVFSLWAVSERLLGPHNPWPLHLLSLLLHVGNACLTGWLAYQLIPNTVNSAIVKPVGAIAAAALFTTFPFSYQVIPSPGSQSKPLSTFLILLACLLYWQGRSGHKTALVTASVLAALLAPFAYEAAVTGGGFLILMEWLLWRKGRITKPSPYALPLILVGIPFIAVWRIVPSSYDPVSFPGWEALWQSSIYFLQGLTWPVALLAKPLMSWTGLSDGMATAWVAYSTLALLAAFYLWRRRTRVLVVSAVWYALSLVVQWVSLSFRYVIDGPRMLYTASVGMALIWADLVISVMDHPEHRVLGRIIGTMALVAMVGWGSKFAIERIDLCERGLAPLIEATDRAIEAKADDLLLFINMPSWVTLKETDFALGHEGYTLLPPYYGVGLDDFVYVNTGAKRNLELRSFSDIRQEWSALIGYHGKVDNVEELAQALRQATRVWVLGYERDRLKLVEVGGVSGMAIPDKEASADHLALFAEAIALQDVRYKEMDGRLRVELLWQAHRILVEPYTAFVHLYADDGQLVAQADGLPLGGTFPFRLWQPGDTVRDLRTVVLPQAEGVGEYVLGVGLYRSDTGQRAPAVASRREPLADNMYRSRIQVH